MTFYQCSGSASVSVSQRYGSEDLLPDPHQNVTDPNTEGFDVNLIPGVLSKQKSKRKVHVPVRHVTGNDEDYLRKIPRVVVQKSALL
jgi:hypothetical protein